MPVGGIQVSVLGDIAWQEVLVPDGDSASQYTRHTSWIGAPLIRQLIEAAMVDIDQGSSSKKHDPASQEGLDQKAASCVVRYRPGYNSLDFKSLETDPDSRVRTYEAWDALLNACGQYSATLGAFPRTSQSTKRKDTVLRIARDLRATQARRVRPASIEALLKDWATEASDAEGMRRIVVIYDRGLFLRNNMKSLEAALDGLTEQDAVIFAIEGQVEGTIDSAQLSSTTSKHLGDLLSIVRPEVRDRAIVVLTAASLRMGGLQVSEYAPLEQVVRDVVSQLRETPLAESIRYCRHLVVSNQESALLHIVAGDSNTDMAAIKGSIHICPNWDRLAQSDHTMYGFMPSKLWIVLAAIVMKVCKEMRNEPEDGLEGHQRWDLAPALRLGIVAFNHYARDGFDSGAPFETIKNALSSDTREALRNKVAHREREFLVSSLRFDGGDFAGDRSWNRLKALFASNSGEQETLYRIVEEGVDAAFREKRADSTGDPQETEIGPWFPGFAIDCPYAEFGAIKLVDEKEIKSFVSLSKLIEKYLREKSWTKPLSIAVFGAPGSGKSFAVKEIIKSVNPENLDRDPPTFNLAQFSSVQDLTEAFHMVQDRVLASSAVPLVIFDEFDCYFQNTALGWLKYFLAPMQDGQFHGHNQDYRIGRAIFLFSGGTAHTYKEFRGKLGSELESNLRSQVKLNDFNSRLRGHLDVLSLDDEDSRPEMLRVRRAIMLRSVLEKLAEPIFRPDGGVERRAAIQRQVTDRFLSKWRFEHGVRSLEAVIQASRWIGGAFVLSSLPDEEQLASHVRDRGQAKVVP